MFLVSGSPEVVYHLKFEMFISEMLFALHLFYSCKYFEDLVLLFHKSLVKEHSQFIFLMNHCLLQTIVIQQSLWPSRWWALPVGSWSHVEILPSPQQGWPSELAGVSVSPVDRWAGSKSMFVWWGHKIITSNQSLLCCQFHGQRSGQWAEYLWAGCGETVWDNVLEISCLSQLVTAHQDFLCLSQSESI